MKNPNPYPVHESKNSDKVVKLVHDLTEYCSVAYARKIEKAYYNGELYGLYFTKSGKIKAIFC